MSNLKTEIQNNVLNLADTYNHLIIEFATGLGKTLTAIKLIEKYGGIWNIVIAETNHEQNWVDEFKKHKKTKLLKNVKFFCYQSLHKNTLGENYIFDEAHHLSSDKRIELLQEIASNNLNRLVGLSATLTRTQHETLKYVLGNYYTYKIGLSEAIDAKILPEPVVYLVGLELDTVHKIHQFNFNKIKWMMCTEQVMYDKLTDKVNWLKDRYMQSREPFHKISWLKAANNRKKFLAECKTKYAKIILSKLEDKRLICFTSSIQQSEEISNGLSIHSKLPKDKRTKLIQDFNNGVVNKLFATQMLKEGMNLSNIDVGIIVQLDNVERYLIQILGRSMRSIAPLQYILYFKNTQDEKYVENVTANFNKNYIKHINMNEL